MYIIVLNNDPNSLSVLLVYFFVLTTNYQNVFIVSQLQWNGKRRSNILFLQFRLYFLFSTFIPTFCDSCLYIFVLDNNLPDKICCYWITVKCLILIKSIVLLGRPVYCCSWQLFKHSITCDCTLLMSPSVSVLSHTFAVLKYL